MLFQGIGTWTIGKRKGARGGVSPGVWAMNGSFWISLGSTTLGKEVV